MICPTCKGKTLKEDGTNRYLCYKCQKFINEPKPKVNKYGAEKTPVDGILFDSKAEANYYSELKLRQRAGDIKAFVIQPRFLLVEANNGNRRAEYRADFGIVENDGTFTVVDVKGMETAMFKIKRKMFEEQTGIKLEVAK
jgi:hypothetical protein